VIPNDPSQYGFHVLRDLYGVENVHELDPAAFNERVRAIHKGWSSEHEFAAIATWLGNPRLVVSVDEVLHSDGHYRVPDFLVVVRRGDCDVKFLVEVKDSTEDKLVWSEKYLAAMRRYADMLGGLPVLVAWKWNGMWMLVDIEQIQKKETAYHLEFKRAAKHNLMSMIFGNVFLVIKEGFRLEFKFKSSDPDASASALPTEGEHIFTIVDAGLYTSKGKLSKDLTSDLFPLMLARALEPITESEGDCYRYMYPADHENMFNASELLIATLNWLRKEDEEVDWLVALRQGLASPIEDLRGVLNRGIEAGAIQYVLDQQPEVVPAFLVDPPNEKQ
jgi:Holliday junction resolvase